MGVTDSVTESEIERVSPDETLAVTVVVSEAERVNDGDGVNDGDTVYDGDTVCDGDAGNDGVTV